MAASSCSGSGTGEQRQTMRRVMGPHAVDQAVGQALHMCWMMLPDDNKTIDELERQIQRVLQRKLEAIREDAESFGFSHVQSNG